MVKKNLHKTFLPQKLTEKRNPLSSKRQDSIEIICSNSKLPWEFPRKKNLEWGLWTMIRWAVPTFTSRIILQCDTVSCQSFVFYHYRSSSREEGSVSPHVAAEKTLVNIK